MDDGWVERMRQHSIILNTPGHFRGGLLPRLAMRLYNEFRKADTFSPLIHEFIALFKIILIPTKGTKNTKKKTLKYMPGPRASDDGGGNQWGHDGP